MIRSFSRGLASAVLMSALLLPQAFGAVPSDERLQRPAADQLDKDLLNAAVHDSVANGVATLLARASLPDNRTGLVYPPISQRRVVDYEETSREVRYSKKKVKVPIYHYETKEVDRLVPKKDEYGDIVGYERKKVKVRVRGKITGYKTVEKVVSDPEGSIVKTVTHRKPIYGPGGPDLIPRGWWGMNGMALYVLCEAGLSDDERVVKHARTLSQRLDRHGVPDHTWDIAWLAAGYIALASDRHAKLTDALVSRLIDGQMRERRSQGEGLWGPVCIHYEILGKFFDVELKLRDELKKLEMAGAPANALKKKRWQDAQRKLVAALNDVMRTLAQNSQQGKRLLEVTKLWKFDEETVLAGLPLYIYNRHLSDIDSTAAVAFALRYAAEAKRLPEKSLRIKVQGRELARPESTASTLSAALEAVADAQTANGGWDPINGLDVVEDFDKLQSVILQDVPFKGKLPLLTRPESWRSNLAGASAFVDLLFLDRRGRSRQMAKLAAAEARMRDIAQAYLTLPFETGAKAGNKMVYSADKETADDLLKGNGQLRLVPWQDRPIGELPHGHRGCPHELLPYLASLHRLPEAPAADQPIPERHQDVQQQLRYRLLITQSESGQWGPAGRRSRGLSASEYAYGLQQAALRYVDQLRKAKDRGQAKRPKNDKKDKDAKAGKNTKQRDKRDFSYSAILSRIDHPKQMHVDTDLYATIHALVYLVDGLQGPVDLSAVTILPDPASLQPEAVEEKEGEEGEADEQAPAEPPTLDAALVSRQVTRPNESLAILLADLMKRFGIQEIAAPPKPAEEAEADADNAAEGADEKAEAAKEKDVLDDILGPGMN